MNMKPLSFSFSALLLAGCARTGPPEEVGTDAPRQYRKTDAFGCFSRSDPCAG